MNQRVDAILLEVFSNALISIGDEMATAMKRTSRSTNARPLRYTCSVANGCPDAFNGMQMASANEHSESVGWCGDARRRGARGTGSRHRG